MLRCFFIKATLKTWKLLLTSSTHSHVFSSCWGVGPAWGVSNDWRKRLHRRRQDATNSQKADGNNEEAGELIFDGLHRLAEKKLDRAVRVASLEKMLLPVRRLKKCVHKGQIVLKWSMNLQGRHSKMRFILVINVKKSQFFKNLIVIWISEYQWTILGTINFDQPSFMTPHWTRFFFKAELSLRSGPRKPLDTSLGRAGRCFGWVVRKHQPNKARSRSNSWWLESCKKSLGNSELDDLAYFWWVFGWFLDDLDWFVDDFIVDLWWNLQNTLV